MGSNPIRLMENYLRNSRNRRKRRPKKKQKHSQDRVGRAYEAPSRFIVPKEPTPFLKDEDINEEMILRGLGVIP